MTSLRLVGVKKSSISTVSHHFIFRNILCRYTSVELIDVTENVIINYLSRGTVNYGLEVGS